MNHPKKLQTFKERFKVSMRSKDRYFYGISSERSDKYHPRRLTKIWNCKYLWAVSGEYPLFSM